MTNKPDDRATPEPAAQNDGRTYAVADARPPKDNILGLRAGRGHDQYAGRVAGGESGGGAYPNPHTGSSDPDARADDSSARHDQIGGQTHQGYHGGGQAGADGSDSSGDDHNAASRSSAASDPGPTYQDHASQQGGEARRDFDAAVARAETTPAKP